MMRGIRLWLPVIAWAGAIFYLSSIPSLRVIEAWWDIIVRKLAHLFVFGVLAWLYARALVGTTHRPWEAAFKNALVATLL